MQTSAGRLVCSAAIAAIAIIQSAAASEARLAPEEVMTRFLKAFVAYDYDTCRSLLAPDASIAITRRYDGEPYRHVYQTADKWLNEVGDTGIKQLKEFSVEIHESVKLVHEHGATVVLRFTATGSASYGVFRSLGFDTGSLIDTPQGWRILHYSSFEEFRRGDAEASPQN